VHVIDPTALELLEHASQIEELRNLQNFGEGVSRMCPEYERWTERGQERADHHDKELAALCLEFY